MRALDLPGLKAMKLRVLEGNRENPHVAAARAAPPAPDTSSFLPQSPAM